uniref:Uncharacterized protein n=1 Tax=Triticum urartu TaxID=4572 RepID=A0A8R7U5C7_TRIUA
MATMSTTRRCPHFSPHRDALENLEERQLRTVQLQSIPEHHRSPGGSCSHRHLKRALDPPSTPLH